MSDDLVFSMKNKRSIIYHYRRVPDWPTEDDWDSYGAKATTPEAIESAQSVVQVPTTKGGVLIEHEDFIVEILPDGTIDPVVYVNGHDVVVPDKL